MKITTKNANATTKANTTKAALLPPKSPKKAKTSTASTPVEKALKAATEKSNDAVKQMDIASTITKSHQPEMVALLAQLEEQCKSWENGSYKKSNDELYQVLANCLIFCGDTGKRNAKKRVKSLKEFYEKRNYAFNENASLTKKVVGAVFGNIDRRRIGTYAVVIEAAKIAKITPNNLPAWIDEQGGIQEIRLAKSATFVSPTEKFNFVSTNLTLLPSLGVLKSDKLSAKSNSDKKGKNCVLLATQKADGSFDIRELIYSTSVVKAAQVSIYKDHKLLVAQKQTTSRKAKA